MKEIIGMYSVKFVEKYEKCETIEEVMCPYCGKFTSFTKIKKTMTGCLLSIPIIKTTIEAYVHCHSCGTTFIVHRKNFKKIQKSKDVEYAISDYRKEIEDKYGNGFSPKKQGLAVFLAIFTMYGAPFFYLGKPLYGLLCIIYSFTMVTLFSNDIPVLPLWFALGFAGLVYAFRLSLGKCKDNDGKYIASKKQQEALTRKTL